MRKFLFLLALLLAACGGNGPEPLAIPDAAQPPAQPPPVTPPPAQPPVQHAPEITSLVLSPDTVDYVEGNDTVVVSAEISFRDAGSDLQALWVKMPDGTAIEFDASFATETGTFAEDLVMSTKTLGSFLVEFWLVDQAGDRSMHRIGWFSVAWKTQSSDWTNRLSGLSHALNDVIWDGDVFVAVGDAGTILTSVDGIDWVAKQSGTTAGLNAVASYGPEIFAVGDETVLLSTDHGESWSEKEKHFVLTDLRAVDITSSQVVVSGFSYGLAGGIISRSEDRGDTWHFADIWSAGDIIYRNGRYVAPIGNYFSSRARVAVSSDGSMWNEIIVRDEGAGLFAIVHDGSQFIAAGSGGAVFTSLDGINWTELETSVPVVSYMGAAWSGSRLVLAGGSMCGLLYPCTASLGEVPVGISSTDGGLSWEMFNIDGDYRSHGLAWGDGRFVSVGWTPDPYQGAIYTSD